MFVLSPFFRFLILARLNASLPEPPSHVFPFPFLPLFYSILRAFLIEEQKIVKVVQRERDAAEAVAKKAALKAKKATAKGGKKGGKKVVAKK